MKVVFDLDDSLVAVEAQEIAGREGQLLVKAGNRTYGITGFDEVTAKKYVMEAYLNKGVNLTGYLMELVEEKPSQE